MRRPPRQHEHPGRDRPGSATGLGAAAGGRRAGATPPDRPQRGEPRCGVGRAVAIKLASAGWRVVAVGRREDALRETASLCKSDKVTTAVCDVADPAAVDRMAKDVLRQFPAVDALVTRWHGQGPAHLPGLRVARTAGVLRALEAQAAE